MDSTYSFQVVSTRDLLAKQLNDAETQHAVLSREIPVLRKSILALQELSKTLLGA